MELIDRTLTELHDALQGKKVSSVELTEQWIKRAEANTHLNCYVSFDAAGFLRQAVSADNSIAKGEKGPLLGVPIALKDNIDAIGFPCGNGTGALNGRHPVADAELVARLRSAGALFPGKVGLHELAFGITTNNAVTGAVRNPWDTTCIPGGSSGGSGAIVAARLVPAAIGTDTGGSVRVPAALCGVAGFRPTVGRVSGDGIAPISSTRDTAGPLARSVADLTLLDGVLSGDSRPLEQVSLKGLRLGVPRDYFWSDVEPKVSICTESALDTLRREGVELVAVDLPGLEKMNGEVSFVVALYEFVRDMTAYLANKSRGVTFQQLIEGIGSPDVRAIAAPLLGDGAVPEAAYLHALKIRKQLQAVYAEAFRACGVSALLFPTTPRTAAPIGQDESVLLNGQASPTFATFIRNTDPGSNASLPGLSLPIGHCDGLPVGLALDGPLHSDRRLLAIGASVEAALPRMPLAPTLG